MIKVKIFQHFQQAEIYFIPVAYDMRCKKKIEIRI